LNIDENDIDKIDNILNVHQKNNELIEDINAELNWNDIPNDTFESLVTIRENIRQRGLKNKLKLLQQYDEELDGNKKKEEYKPKLFISITYIILATAAIITIMILTTQSFFSDINKVDVLEEIYSDFNPPASPEYTTRSESQSEVLDKKFIEIFKQYDQAQNYLNVEDYEKADNIYRQILIKMKSTDRNYFEEYISYLENKLKN